MEETHIPGLTFIDNFITEEEEKFLVEKIDAAEWSTEISRKIQQYGYHVTNFKSF